MQDMHQTNDTPACSTTLGRWSWFHYIRRCWNRCGGCFANI